MIPFDCCSLGTHYSKKKNYFSTVSSFYKETGKKSIQIFTASPKSWSKPTLDEDDLRKTKEFVEENNIKLFIHSLYFINLSRLNDDKALKSLKWELSTGSRMGAKGVVVHVGKSLKMEKKEAVDNMYENIKLLLSDISEECPLLIETPAGQGTECLKKIEDFMDFMGRFSGENRVMTCIDTCHVWSSNCGYYPSDYISKFMDKFPDKLIVVHYNDSKCEKGSNKDRHEYPGKGFIGASELSKVSDLCIENNIPMIIE